MADRRADKDASCTTMTIAEIWQIFFYLYPDSTNRKDSKSNDYYYACCFL
ncbi:MAG: hypothetical protein ACOXZV_08295 [Bacteroidales bacterium]